jgi:hypothetical protein
MVDVGVNFKAKPPAVTGTLVCDLHSQKSAAPQPGGQFATVCEEIGDLPTKKWTPAG